MGRSQNDGVKMTNFEPREKMFHVHKSAIEENDFKEHVNFYTGPAPSEDFVTLYTAPRKWVGLDDDIPGLGLVTEEFYNGMLCAEDILRRRNT
jgi:hypothetical protein